ncbi:2-oxoglutarate dehydrogenase complex component E1-like [Anthonomus grandis grandis]|uniref:2-oxoglutarate dehydrogenase complex component E1-like n=1 Tax=Anthonomus grandis grandis TaxID=2921223 RepID=UPI002164FC9E|nr:2-oxoglutarate dehydrogenase complex component E1-like [Anthonomus grandis grandis]
MSGSIFLSAISHIRKALHRSISLSRYDTAKNAQGPFPPTKNPELPVDGTSAVYLEEMYKAWLTDPKSVHQSWDAYFRSLTSGGTAVKQSGTTPTLFSSTPSAAPPLLASAPAVATADASSASIEEHMHVQAIIRSYQVRGHLVARLDPLEDMFDVKDKTTSYSEKYGQYPPEVIRYHRLDANMLNNTYTLPPSTKIGGDQRQLPLKEILKRLELTYCRHIGLEYMHIHDVEQCDWIRSKFETPGAKELKKPEKRLLLNRLGRAVLFEDFLKKKWSSEKRFGLEGCEVMIPSIKTIIDEFAKNGGEMAIIGMAHRGRLNVLANICKKPLELIFSQFRGLQPEDEGAGDVKYHLGVYNKRILASTNKDFTTVLVANPSHLEMVNPVCAGRVKAEQVLRNDVKGDKVIPIIMHGDAAICGEGVVYETINMANLIDYHNGGTIHVIVNNKIGFTTDPKYSRSSPYCTDVGKTVEAPIFHVNGDDPEEAIYVAKMAAQFRSKFHKDVVVDLTGYRRYGHNEMDEPMFTHPVKYTLIQKTPNVFEKYAKVAVETGVVTQEEVKAFREEQEKQMEADFGNAAKHTTIRFGDWIDSPWKNFFKNKDPNKCEPTGVSLDVIKTISEAFSHEPKDFVIHKALQRVMHARQEMLKQEIADWAMGEAIAIGSLVHEGIPVRVSGQDVQRGTFSHRHHMVHHQTKDNTRYQYLKDIFPGQAKYEICNSPISEYGILGFEHGYSMADPNSLVIWEAQFGDFANNGQAMFDCMIASGQWKWVRQCGLVILLPHGLEGMGPEHSSARMERMLQLCSDNADNIPPNTPEAPINQLREINWIVANVTTPANLFHIWRRQIKLPFRKPLLVFTPKSLLRHPEARSKFDEMKEGTEFRRVYPETGPASKNPVNAAKLIFCTGKVYFDFIHKIKEAKMEEKIALVRVEQIAPFPYDLVGEECSKYANAMVCWGQEEHKNSGAWTYVEPRLNALLKGQRKASYIGRAPSASTSSGNKIQYNNEFEALMNEVVKSGH